MTTILLITPTEVTAAPVRMAFAAAGHTIATSDLLGAAGRIAAAGWSLIVVDEAVGRPNAMALVEAIKGSTPLQAILWLAPAQETLPPFDQVMPDAILTAPLTSADLTAVLDRSPQGQVPEALRTALREAGCAALWDAYQVELQHGETIVRARRRLEGSVHAVLTFCGPDLAGSVVVTGDHDHLARILLRLFPDRQDVTLAEVQDLAGEMSNLLCGRLKEIVVQHGSSLFLGLPMIVTGSPCTLSFTVPDPRVICWLQDPTGALAVEILLDRLDPAAFRSLQAASIAPPGDMTFF
ncbi:MAG: chemotaxis protein CheX [Candidatus Sericytochromatia bacterium]|nr:chemotaxis protein CheX [Candidatus Sericytochromatia bacterium]